MGPSSRRGVLSRALLTVVLAGLLFVGLPMGQPVTPGGWPSLGLVQLWNGLADWLRPDAASAEPAHSRGLRQGPPAPPPPPVRLHELAERRSPVARVFAMSDGSFEAELSPEPVSYRDGQGQWRDVDLAVRPGGRDGFRFSNDTNGFRSSFGDSTDRLVRFELGDRRVTVGVEGPKRAVEPKASGSTVRYPGVFEGADLAYQVTGEALKETLSLSRLPRDGTFRFTMRLDGVTAATRPDGSIGFFPTGAGADGPPVFTMPRPFMTDSRPDGKSPYGKSWSDKVTQTVEQHGSEFTVTVQADHDWLAAPDRKYPVVIDPTIKIEPTPTTGQDVQIWSDTPTRNDGSSYQLSVGTDNFGIARSLLKFDTSMVPAGTSLSSAKLRVYYDNELFTGANNVTIEARRVTQSWAEDTATWNTINSAFAEAGLSTQVKQANRANVWHEFDVRNIAQSWASSSAPNFGLMLKSTNETLSFGGAIYQAAEFAYNGEIENRPKLILSYGRPSVDLRYPTKINSTGADLSWAPYVDPDPSNPNDDVVEYQVHRAVFQTFTPSASTLIAPLPPTATSFSDTTARPTPADSPDPFGNAYYYMIAAKTRDGQLIPGPTQVSRLPKAGLVTQIFHGGTGDATLSANQPTTNLNSLAGQPWVMAGNNSGTYGRARSVVRFPDLSVIPAGARIVSADFQLWAFFASGTGASFDTHALSKPFVAGETTWNRASAATAWTTPGGDFGPALGNVATITNDPKWQIWSTTSTVQGWVNNPNTNNGYLVKLHDEAGPAERALFLSNEAAEPQLRPNLVVTYTQPTAEQTYYAPDTPSVKMVSGDQYTVPVTLTNTTGTTWTAATQKLSYRLNLPDGTDITGANRLETALPADVPPNGTVTVNAAVKTILVNTEGNKREQQVVSWDLRNTSTNTWLSATGGPPALPQNVSIEDPTSDELGLEKFYSYTGLPTGAGSNVLVNEHAGNAVWSYDAFSNPGRGLNTFLRLTYNSFDTTTALSGYGWSLAAAGITRLGSHLELHPPGQDFPTRVTLPDGDGTSHVFLLNKNNSSDPAQWFYEHPHGVHLFLQRDSAADPSRRWTMTSPDRTVFLFDDEGWLTAIRDRNGNEQTFTYTQRKSNNQPRKFLTYVTDPAGRRTLTLDYWEKGETSNPHILDQIQSIVDISGRRVTFAYSDKGLLTDLVDGAGSTQPKPFHFDYDATQGNKNVKLVAIRDPRGNTTRLAYYTAPVDPKNKWKPQTITDRLGFATSFTYTDPDGPQGSEMDTTVTDRENHTATVHTDGFGRPTRNVNAKNQPTSLVWDTDHNVISLTEANNAVSTWTYDTKTGYPTSIRDAEAVANNTPATVLGYQTTLNGYIADLTFKTTPEGRRWEFGYDTRGNLTTVTDPKGVATPSIPDDFQTVHTYDQFGLPQISTDANGNTTTFNDYDLSVGYPRLVTDALNNLTRSVFDARGNVTLITDARGKVSSYTYDAFGRPLESRAPMDADVGRFIITPPPNYDPNDNITQATAPNGAVSTASYDTNDRLTSTDTPKDTPTGPARTTSYTYDRVGNPLTETQPLGNLTPGDPNDFVTRYAYDEIYELVSVTDAASQRTTYSYDNVGNLTKLVDPRKDATTDPNDFTVTATYDRAHRPRTETDAMGFVTRTDYNRDGNVVSTTDKENNTTTLVYDERAKLVEQRVPHKQDGSTLITHITRFEYDEVGNKTRTISPRGVETTDDPDDFAVTTTYDRLNRPAEQRTAYDRDDATIRTPDSMFYGYDQVGNLTTVDAPASAGQTVRNVARNTYFDNGWVHTTTDPWDIATTYDYNPLGQQTTRKITSAGGSSNRTIALDYFPDGKLKFRTDGGVPVGQHVALVDNSDTANVTIQGTWNAATGGAGFTGFDYNTAPAGTGAGRFTWTPVVPADGTYEIFVRYPTAVSGAASNAPYTVDSGTARTTTPVDQRSAGGQWVSLGRYQLTAGNTATITLTDAANGTVLADSVKLVRDNTGEPDNESKTLTHGYDVNGNLTTLTDSSPGATIDTFVLGYNGLNQLGQVDEKLAGVVKTTTTYSYDQNGNPRTRNNPKQNASFTYDPRDLLDSSTATEPGQPAKTTRYTYFPRGMVQHETKANGNTVDYTYTLDALQASQVEKKSDTTTLVSQHFLNYDANGQKIRDASKTQNADNTASYLDEIHEWVYDPRDRVRRVTKKAAPNGAVLEVEDYAHDANNNVISQTIENQTSSFTYNRNRLVNSTSGAIVAKYNYDPFGRLDTITSAGQIIESYTYDGFDRTATHKKRDTTGTLKATNYTYDPLDRTTTKTDNAGTPSSKTTSFAYLGLTDQVLDETLNGQVQRTYQYDAFGRRLSQVKKDTDGAGPETGETSFYGYNPHTDVETLTKDNGDTRATYGYTAYGSDDQQAFTGIDKPDVQQPGKEPYNFYRYTGKRFDPASASYDMGFRDYNPGLNRFLVRDTYNGALADLNLGTNTWTGNRYAFTGGNPITSIEHDGHCAVDEGVLVGCATLQGEARADREQKVAQHWAAQQKVTGVGTAQQFKNGTVAIDLGANGKFINGIHFNDGVTDFWKMAEWIDNGKPTINRMARRDANADYTDADTVAAMESYCADHKGACTDEFRKSVTLEPAVMMNGASTGVGGALVEAAEVTGLARAVGLEGEELAGILKNTSRIDVPGNPGKFRIPDELNREAGVIGEVKNTAYQYFSTQLKDYAAYAKAYGYEFRLYVRGTASNPLTKLSGPLQEAVDSGAITLRYLGG